MLRNKHKYTTNIVAHPYKLVFFKLSKNACTSIAIRLAELLELPKREDFPLFIHQKKHYPFVEATEDELRTTYQDYLRFAIIRNPWERLVSCYVDKIFPKNDQNEYFLNINPQFHKGMPFEDFVEAVAQTPDRQADAHFCGQLYWLSDLQGNLPVDYLASMDDLETHLLEIEALTGAKLSGLSKHNATQHRDYSSYYTSEELIEKVRQRFQFDIDFFGFKFGSTETDFPFGKINKGLHMAFTTADFRATILGETNLELIELLQKAEEHFQLKEKHLKDAKQYIETLNTRLITKEEAVEQSAAKLKAYEQAIEQLPGPLRFVVKKRMRLD